MTSQRGWPFGLAFLSVLVVSGGVLFYGLGAWSWDVDEVESLHELRLFNATHPRLDDPASQANRLPRLVPLWYACQKVMLRWLGVSEFNARVMPAACGLAAVLIVFFSVARRTSLLLGTVTALVMAVNPLFITLVQQNRYYSMALLFQASAQAVVLARTERNQLLWMLVAAGLAVLAVLSHNLLLVYFVLAAFASLIAYRMDWINRGMLARAITQGVAAVVLYVVYIRPILSGWNEAGERRGFLTVWLSFFCDNGVPVVGLALVGAALAITRGDKEQKWWSVQLALCGAFVALSPLGIYYFNYRYAVLFLLPFWMLAAYAVVEVGKLMKLPGAAAWTAAVVLLFLPKVLSHAQDGTRKNYRQAAALLQPLLVEHSPVYCNMQSTLWYYLPDQDVRGWPLPDPLPRGECFVVLGGNAWTPPIRVPCRQVTLLASIAARRFDEQSYQVWVYRIAPAS